MGRRSWSESWELPRSCNVVSTLPPRGTGALLFLDFIFLCNMQKLKREKKKGLGKSEHLKAKHDKPIC